MIILPSNVDGLISDLRKLVNTAIKLLEKKLDPPGGGH